MNSLNRGALLLSALGLFACSGLDGNYPSSGSLIPDANFQITPDYQIALADMLVIAGVAVLVYVVVDPKAPAWAITETRYPDNRVVFDMKMKDFHAGGSGEARQVLERRARALTSQLGMAGFDIRRYEESIDSRMWLPHRKAEAEVLLYAKQ